MRAPHSLSPVPGKPPSGHVTHAHPLQVDQTSSPGTLSSYDLLYLCDHLLLCSLADSGSMILFFPVTVYPED